MGCAASEKTFTERELILKKISAEKYGLRFNTFYNKDSTYALIIREEKASALNPNPALRFIVYSIGGEKIILEENLSSGHAAWIDSEQIEVRITGEVISSIEKDNFFGYIYNVKTGTKSDLNPASQK
jgi:hypothetical protein